MVSFGSLQKATGSVLTLAACVFFLTRLFGTSHHMGIGDDPKMQLCQENDGFHMFSPLFRALGPKDYRRFVQRFCMVQQNLVGKCQSQCRSEFSKVQKPSNAKWREIIP